MSDKCPIWETEAQDLGLTNRDARAFESRRAGGTYVIARRAGITIERSYKHDHRFKARLTSWLVEQRELGIEYPEISESTLEEIESRRNLPVHERADRLLKAISSHSPYIGFDVYVSEQFIGWNLLACSECINQAEVDLLINYLIENSWLAPALPGQVLITVQGYSRLAELENQPLVSTQAFIAMWFDPSMEQAYQEGIKPGVENAGFKPLRIDKKEHNNKIDDEIIAELRRSQFVVADFTQGETGARGGVYYEAGFAQGLGVPVIFCCREDAIKEVHFDTRQYNHIVWKEPTDLRDALAKRISAVIGDGPERKA